MVHDPLRVGSITRNHHDPKLPNDDLHLKAQRAPSELRRVSVRVEPVLRAADGDEFCFLGHQDEGRTSFSFPQTHFCDVFMHKLERV